MNKINNGVESIELIVGKSFLRVVKNHAKYFVVMQMFRRLPRVEKLRNSAREEPLRESSREEVIAIPKSGKYEDFLKSLGTLTSKEWTNKKMSGNAQRYEYITVVINHLLHNLLERGGVHPKELGIYGQEIFDLACYSAFGDEFIDDMECMKKEHPEMMNRNNVQSQLENEYRQRYSHGEELSFESFMKKYHRDLIGSYDEDSHYDEMHLHDEDIDNIPF